MNNSSQMPERADRQPIWANEPITVVGYDSRWPELAARECSDLQELLAAWLTGGIEHVGSTAIPGMSAKPILDLQAPIDDLDCSPQIAAVLAPHTWHYVPPELDRRPFRRFLVKSLNGRRVAHLHLMTLGSARWHEQLVFRDALRNSPELISRYCELKRGLAERYSTNREAYAAGKQHFVEQVITRTNEANRR